MTHIFAVGGGKGGIGKTTIVASLGVGLASFGKKVIVIDADLVGADLHLILGIEKPEKTIYNFIIKENKKLAEILMTHPQIDNLKIISGINGALEIANLNHNQKLKYIKHLRQLDADFVILDLGAGHSKNVLDFFLAADQGIVVVKPDHLSINASYNFIKLALFRKIINFISSEKNATKIAQELLKPDTYQKKFSLTKISRQIGRINANLGKKIKLFLRTYNPILLINELRNSEDEKKCLQVKDSVQIKLGINMEYIGAIHWDESVPKSLDQLIPFINYDVSSRASKDILNIISNKILGNRILASVREKHTARKNIREVKAKTTDNIICYESCLYWNSCIYRDAGYPCMMYRITRIFNI